MVNRLKDLEINQRAKIVGYRAANSAYKARLLSMGLTLGAEVKLVKIAPFGDPVELNLRGYNLLLRKAEADILEIEVTTND